MRICQHYKLYHYFLFNMTNENFFKKMFRKKCIRKERKYICFFLFYLFPIFVISTNQRFLSSLLMLTSIYIIPLLSKFFAAATQNSFIRWWPLLFSPSIHNTVSVDFVSIYTMHVLVRFCFIFTTIDM